MQATIQVKLKPFQVPNYVLAESDPTKKDEGWQEAPKYRLCDLDADTLAALCEQFTREIFVKAGKQRPPQCVGAE